MNSAVVIGLALLFAAPTAGADELPRFQAALHSGYRVGGSLEDRTSNEDRDLDEDSSIALALELQYRKGDDRYYQLWYSRQESQVNDGLETHDIDVEYLHIGGTLPFGEYGRAQPYFAAGIGATRFSSPAAGADDRTHLSGSAGVGLSIPLAEHAAIRFEARGYLTAVDTDSAIFCRSDNLGGVCRIVASGSSLFQAEALLGIAFQF